MTSRRRSTRQLALEEMAQKYAAMNSQRLTSLLVSSNGFPSSSSASANVADFGTSTLSHISINKSKVSKRKSDVIPDGQGTTTLKKFASCEDEHMEVATTSNKMVEGHAADASFEFVDCDEDSDEIRGWIEAYHKFSNTDRLDALSSLMSTCSLNEVRNVSETIAPYFQKDFLLLLPREISIFILQHLAPEDLLNCARVNRVWRTISEDAVLWREQCMERSYRPDLLPTSSTSGACHSRSKWKSIYLRHTRINLNWRNRRDPRPSVQGSAHDPNRTKFLRAHDEHVITCLQVDDDYVVSGSDDNTLRVFDASNGKLLHVLTGHNGGVWSSVLAVGLGIVVSGSTDRMVRVWDLKTGKCMHTLTGHTSTVRCMTMHGKTLITGSRDATLRIWDVLKGECLNVLSGHGTAVRCVAFDGERIVSGSYDSTLRVWDVATVKCLHTLHGHLNRVYSLLLDGKRDLVVSGSLDTTIRIWDIADGRMLHVLIGHSSLTSGMALYGTQYLVSGNADNSIKVWNIEDGQMVHTLQRHEAAVTSLTLLQNGLLVTSSDDGSAKLWDISTGTYVRDLIKLDTSGQGGCIWRLKATASRLVCAAGSRNNVEDTKLIIMDFNAEYP